MDELFDYDFCYYLTIECVLLLLNVFSYYRMCSSQAIDELFDYDYCYHSKYQNLQTV